MLLAGATIPTVSPGWSVGGLIRDGIELSGILDANLKPLRKKLSPTNELSRTQQEYFLFPTDRLHSARSMNSQWRLCLCRRYCCYGCCTRPRPRRLSLANSPFEEANVNIAAISDHHELEVNSLFELRQTTDLLSLCSPIGGEPVYEDYIMGIAHRNLNTDYFTRRQRNRRFRAHLRLSHGSLELIFGSVARLEDAGFEPGAGSDDNSFFQFLRAQIGRNTACSISRNLRFRTVGIKEAGIDVGILRREKPLDAICSNAPIAIAHFPAKLRQIGSSVNSVDD